MWLVFNCPLATKIPTTNNWESQSTLHLEVKSIRNPKKRINWFSMDLKTLILGSYDFFDMKLAYYQLNHGDVTHKYLNNNFLHHSFYTIMFI